MAPRDPRTAAARDFDDDADFTQVDGRRQPPAPPAAPRPARPAPAKLPAFVPAETVVPIVSYRQGRPGGPSTPAPAAPRPAAPAPAAPPDLAMALESLEASVVQMAPTRPRPETPAPVAGAAPRGELTVVFGCRGGAGATTLAVNTAAHLTRAGRQVCVVDLDLQLGDVFVALDLEPQTSLASVAREAAAHALDAASLRRRLAQHGSGLCALTQVGHLDELDPGLPARLPALLDTLRAHFDHVVVDGVRDFGDAAIAAIEAATKILVVVTQDVPSVRRAARVLNLLRKLGIDEARCALVVNRAVRGAAIDDAAIERALAMRIAARIREDRKVAEALDAGALLLDVARSRAITSDLARVAALCRPADTERVLPRRVGLRGLFGRGGN